MIDTKIKLDEIYQQNINFLFGSGASADSLPTLSVKAKKSDGKNHTIETISNQIGDANDDETIRLRALLFMHYYRTCIQPMLELDSNNLNESQLGTITNYEKFLSIVIHMLSRKGANLKPVCNFFTTNYDGFIELTADKILTEKNHNISINDGTRGFLKKYLDVKNFNINFRQSGTFSDIPHLIPQINLIHLHGSCYWKKNDGKIEVDYIKKENLIAIDTSILDSFSKLLNNPKSTYDDLKTYASKVDNSFSSVAKEFMESYNKLPIVNPTKWKFHETIFEEHYYEMLRLLSYELEKKDTVLITFGFSFSDQHILKLVQRSLYNPGLQVFICCHNEDDLRDVQDKFNGYKNIKYIYSAEKSLDFKLLTSEVLTNI